MTKRTAFVLKGYPRLSETFIAQEILALEQAGLDLAIVSLRHPTDSRRHPVHRKIQASVLYLPEYLRDAPFRVLRAWWRARRMPGYKKARKVWMRDLKRDFSRNRIRRWGQALVLASEVPADIRHFHAHFLHTPASVTRYAALCRQIPWTCSAHAKDIWTSPDWELSEKLDDAAWTVTCTRYGWQHLQSLCQHPESVHMVYHGLDLNRFAPPEGAARSADHTGIRLLSVGRAVEKKGFDVLIKALANLPEELDWTWHHVGGGDLAADLEEQAGNAGIGARVTWHGAQPQETVMEQYRQADIFVLPCRVADDGDRDGLPNVLIEAQSQGLPCISTPVSGVPELIEDSVNGLLAESEQVDSLTQAVETLARDPAARQRMGQAGMEKVHKKFSHTEGIRQLLTLFGSVP